MSGRGRLAVAVLVALAVGAGGTEMEGRLGPRFEPVEAVPDEVSGAWFCPHGGGQGWKAWVVTLNPTSEPADLAVTTRSSGRPERDSTTLDPATLRYVAVPARTMASATVVEFFRSAVVVGMVVQPPDGGGVAAEPCLRSPGDQWYVPEASTLRGEHAHVVVHNPYAAEAVVELTLLAGKRVVRPGPLKGVVLPPGDVASFNLGRFALGEEALVTAVRAQLGRVVVGGVVVSEDGVRSSIGVPAPSLRWTLPGVEDTRSGRVVISAPGPRKVPFSAQALLEKTEEPLLDLEVVAGETSRSFDVDVADAGVQVDADGPRLYLAGRVLVAASEEPPPRRERKNKGRAGKGRNRDRRARRPSDKKRQAGTAEGPADLASTPGSPSAYPSWAALPPVGPQGGEIVLLLANPSRQEARARISLIGVEGPRGAPTTVAVPPRAEARMALPSEPVAAMVRVGRGSVVAAQAAIDPQAYAVSLGAPIQPG